MNERKYPRQTRSKLRGSPLEADCRRARISRHEMGADDLREFCYGLEDPMREEPCEQCKRCGAWNRGEKVQQ